MKTTINTNVSRTEINKKEPIREQHAVALAVIVEDNDPNDIRGVCYCCCCYLNLPQIKQNIKGRTSQEELEVCTVVPRVLVWSQLQEESTKDSLKEVTLFNNSASVTYNGYIFLNIYKYIYNEEFLSNPAL